MTQIDALPQVGYLKSCIDKRFVAETRRMFEKWTGLGVDQYYHEALAGGALNHPSDFPNFPDHKPAQPDGADYVYSLHGKEINLVAMGWQVHREQCGGLKGLTDDEIVNAFQKLIDAKYFQKKYPQVQKHFFLVVPSMTVIDLTGAWAGSIDSPVGAVISVAGKSFTVDLSPAGRKDIGQGSIIDSSKISVSYTPNGGTFTGTIQYPNMITWSDNSVWVKRW
jgi:hypothetical protein